MYTTYIHFILSSVHPHGTSQFPRTSRSQRNCAARITYTAIVEINVEHLFSSNLFSVISIHLRYVVPGTGLYRLIAVMRYEAEQIFLQYIFELITPTICIVLCVHYLQVLFFFHNTYCILQHVHMKLHFKT